MPGILTFLISSIYKKNKMKIVIYSIKKYNYALFSCCFFSLCSIFLSCNSLNKEVSNEHSSEPNILVILVDDMRWDEYSAVGHPFIKTPNIDRLAREGVNFKNAFATTPLCSPSRASFLTGVYPHSHGIIDNTDRSELSHHLQTFPAKLDTLGYETAFIGKWHMGNDDSKRRGFNYWMVLKGQGEAIDPTFNINGERLKVKGYVTDILTDYSLRFINQKRTEPFLLYLSEKALHPNLMQRNDGSIVNIGEGGFIPAERHKGLYKDAVFKSRKNYGIPPSDRPALSRKIKDLPPLGIETVTTQKDIRGRSEMILAIDEALGKIMDALEAKGELDNTIIVFTSDHGFFYGEHGLSEERRLAYEEAIRIPLLIRYPPKIKAGLTPNQMVLSIDLAPTLIELAGHQPDKIIQGRSLLPVINGKAKDWRSSFLIEYYSDSVYPRIVNMGYKAVRTKRYKYIKYLDLKGMDELYDLKKDSFELKNLIKDPQSKQLLNNMQNELDKLLKN